MFLLLTTAPCWPGVVALDDDEARATMAAPTATLDP